MGNGGKKQPRFHRNNQGGMVTLGVSGLLLTVDPASSKRAVKELQILLEPFKEKVEILELGDDDDEMGNEGSDEEEASNEEDDAEEQSGAKREVLPPLPPVGYGDVASNSLAAELAAELDSFRGGGRGDGRDGNGEKRVQMFDADGNFLTPMDDDDKKKGGRGGGGGGGGPRKEKRDWRAEWFSSLETNCKGHIFINIPKKKTKEDLERDEAKKALREIIDRQHRERDDAAAAASGGGGDLLLGGKRAREDEAEDQANGGDVLDLTALLGGGGGGTTSIVETKATVVEGGSERKEEEEGTAVAVTAEEPTTAASIELAAAKAAAAPPPFATPNLRVQTLVDLLLDNLSADPRPVCRFAYRMYPVWSTCYPTTAAITACCKSIAETAIEVPEGQSAAKVGIHLAIKNNTTVEKDKHYLKAAIEASLTSTRKCICMPRFSGNMTVEVDCVVTVMVMHSICCVGVQTKYHSKYGRRGYNLHSFSKGSMNLADSTTMFNKEVVVAVEGGAATPVVASTSTTTAAVESNPTPTPSPSA